MRPSAMRFLTRAVFAATLVIPVTAAGEGEAAGRHIRKHQQRTSPGWSHSLRRSWAADDVRPVAPLRSERGEVCPGSARAIDCTIWPPPIVDDPDRKTSGEGM